MTDREREELIDFLARLAAFGVLCLVVYWMCVAILSVIGHAVEPIVTLVWRPMFELALMPGNSLYYWSSHAVALFLIWIAIFFGCRGRLRALRHYVVYLAATIAVLETARFLSCISVDIRLSQIYNGSGLCRVSLLNFSLHWSAGWRDSVGDAPLLLTAVGILLYLMLTSLAIAFVTIPAFILAVLGTEGIRDVVGHISSKLRSD